MTSSRYVEVRPFPFGIEYALQFHSRLVDVPLLALIVDRSHYPYSYTKNFPSSIPHLMETLWPFLKQQHWRSRYFCSKCYRLILMEGSDNLEYYASFTI